MTSEAAGPAKPGSFDEKMDVLVERLFQMERADAVHHTTGVGAALVEVLHDGDLAAFHAREDVDKVLSQVSERLANREIFCSRTTLERAVRIHEQAVHFGGYDRWPSLHMGHFRAVLGHAWEEQQRLLDDAEKAKMSAREFEVEVMKARGGTEPDVEPWQGSHKVLSQIKQALTDSNLFGWLRDVGVAHEIVEGINHLATDLSMRVVDLVDQLELHKPSAAVPEHDMEPMEAPAAEPEAPAKMAKKPRAKATGARAKTPKKGSKPAAKKTARKSPGAKKPRATRRS